MNTDTIYITGLTPEGTPLVGGIWRMYRQEGFPVDLSIMIIREKSCLPDIMELFAEATIHMELPQVQKQCPELFDDETKGRWMLYLSANGLDKHDQFHAAEQILLKKRESAIKREDHGKMILACLNLQKRAKHSTHP